MEKLNIEKYGFCVCCGIFLCIVIAPTMETLGMEVISKIIYILGLATGVTGCLIPLGKYIQKWENSEKKDK